MAYFSFSVDSHLSFHVLTADEIELNELRAQERGEATKPTTRPAAPADEIRRQIRAEQRAARQEKRAEAALPKRSAPAKEEGVSFRAAL